MLVGCHRELPELSFRKIFNWRLGDHGADSFGWAVGSRATCNTRRQTKCSDEFPHSSHARADAPVRFTAHAAPPAQGANSASARHVRRGDASALVLVERAMR